MAALISSTSSSSTTGSTIGKFETRPRSDRLRSSACDRISKIGSAIWEFSKEYCWNWWDRETIKQVITYPYVCLSTKPKSRSVRDLVLAPFRGCRLPPSPKGYHFSSQQELSPKELRPYLDYMATQATGHNNDLCWLEGFDIRMCNFSDEERRENQLQDQVKLLPVGLQVSVSCLIEKISGLKLSIFHKGSDEMILAFGAMAAAESELNSIEKQGLLTRQWRLVFTKNRYFGLKPKVYELAAATVDAVRTAKIFKGKKLTLIGQSFGGTLAAYAGLRTKIPTICFNPIELGVGLQHELGQKVLSKADEFITNIIISTDYAGDNKCGILIHRCVSFLGFPYRGIFGKKYKFPTAYPGQLFPTHAYALGSAMKYLGYDVRDKPKVLIDAEKQQK